MQGLRGLPVRADRQGVTSQQRDCKDHDIVTALAVYRRRRTGLYSVLQLYMYNTSGSNVGKSGQICWSNGRLHHRGSALNSIK